MHGAESRARFLKHRLKKGDQGKFEIPAPAEYGDPIGTLLIAKL